MSTALIADDEPHLAAHLAEAVRTLWPELTLLPIASHGLQAAQLIAERQPDVAFLDIQMPGLTGLEVAQGIEGGTRVVFVTAFDEFAVRAFEAHALDYLLKPVRQERLAATVRRLQQALATPALPDSPGAGLADTLRQLQPAPATGTTQTPLRWIRASSGDLTHQISIDEVLYFHADDKYTTVQTAQGEYLIRTPIIELAAALDPAQFWQVHRSTLINVAHLAGTRRDAASRLFLRFKGHGRELPVSRAYVHLFKPM